jgi:hypothetical protein
MQRVLVPQTAFMQLAFQLRYRGSSPFGGRTMNNPLVQETATPQQQPIPALAEASGVTSSSATLDADSRSATATWAGAASSEVDDAIRAIHGW